MCGCKFKTTYYMLKFTRGGGDLFSFLSPFCYVVNQFVKLFQSTIRRGRASHRFELLTNQDDSDGLLIDDDEDEAPLDLNIDFGFNEGTRDEALLHSGSFNVFSLLYT